MLYLHNKVLDGISTSYQGQKSGRPPSLGDSEHADSVQFLVHLWPKRSSSQHLSQRFNHRLTVAITDLVANQSTQTRTHKQAYKREHTTQQGHKYTHVN